MLDFLDEVVIFNFEVWGQEVRVGGFRGGFFLVFSRIPLQLLFSSCKSYVLITIVLLRDGGGETGVGKRLNP